MSKRIFWSIGTVPTMVLLCGLAIPNSAMAQAQDGKLRVIAFGAHPDDCDGKFGGTAAKFAKAGAAVKFVSVTNGDAGHQEMGGSDRSPTVPMRPASMRPKSPRLPILMGSQNAALGIALLPGVNMAPREY
jgi:hypothetical protein